MDENTCMIDVAKYYMTFLKDESCGKCFSCRKGTQRMYEILDDISKGKAKMEDLELLEDLALVVKDASMCGLGQTAANPVLSTLKYFRHDTKNTFCTNAAEQGSALLCSRAVSTHLPGGDGYSVIRRTRHRGAPRRRLSSAVAYQPIFECLWTRLRSRVQIKMPARAD